MIGHLTEISDWISLFNRYRLKKLLYTGDLVEENILSIDKHELAVRKQWLVSLIVFFTFLCFTVLIGDLMERNFLINHIPLRTFIYLLFSLLAEPLVGSFALYYWAYRKKGTLYLLYYLCSLPIYLAHWVITNPALNTAPLNLALLVTTIIVVPSICFWIQCMGMYRVNKAHWATVKDGDQPATTYFEFLFGLFIFFSPMRYLPKVYTPAPIQKAAFKEIAEIIRNANKQADGYILTDNDKTILVDGYSKYLEYVLLENKYQSSFKRGLNSKDPADALTYIVLNETHKQSWALQKEFWLKVFRTQQVVDPNDYKDILGA